MQSQRGGDSRAGEADDKIRAARERRAARRSAALGVSHGC
jgi:hypothetical protein